MSLMNQTFSLNVNLLADTTAELFVNGFMDENAKIDPAIVPENVTSLIVDFDSIKLLNSIGIKTWIQFVDHLDQRPNLKTTYRHCRKQIIECINSIAGFIPKKSEVESFYIMIYCEKCDESFEILKETKKFVAKDFHVIDGLGSLPCSEFPKCRKYLEPDFNPNHYFKFLQK